MPASQSSGISTPGKPTNPYDEVPYESFPFRQTHPERLSTIASLFGLAAPDIHHCRVLEIGCASGGNLLPMAMRHPESQFLGIDLSGRQIQDGQKIIDAVGLTNIELRHQDICDFQTDDSSFDYILCHGVYSWIPDAAQQGVLEICKNSLSEDGIAYVSYNTFPGWHMRGMIRDLMTYRSRNLANPEDRVRQARSLLHFLADSVSKENNPYGMMLQQEARQLQDKDDYYLLHEHLEEFNEPVYFHQFAERAAGLGLQYLAEADYSTMSLQNFPPDVAKMLGSLASDLIEMEQYMDFARNRMFRQTLMCHADRTVDRAVTPQRMNDLYVASPTRQEKKPEGSDDDQFAVFRTGNSVTRTKDPTAKAALSHLGRQWPRYVPFSELVSVAQSATQSGPAIIGSNRDSPQATVLAKTLIRCFETDHVELSVCPPESLIDVPDRPTVSPLVRHMAAIGREVTNHRHQMVRLTDVERCLLKNLDGNHDEAGLVDELVDWMASTEVAIHREGRAITDPEEVRAIAHETMQSAMEKFAKSSLLQPA